MGMFLIEPQKIFKPIMKLVPEFNIVFYSLGYQTATQK